MTNYNEFNIKFEIIEKAVKSNLITEDKYPEFKDKLEDIIATIWTSELEEAGFDAIYEHLRYNNSPPIYTWTLKDLIEQLSNDNIDYWNGNCDLEDRNYLIEFNQLVDQTFSSIEISKLAAQLFPNDIK